MLFGAPIFPIPTDPNDSCYRKGPYLSQKVTRQSPECTICTCHHFTFIETHKPEYISIMNSVSSPLVHYLQIPRSQVRSSKFDKLLHIFPACISAFSFSNQEAVPFLPSSKLTHFCVPVTWCRASQN